MSARREHKRRYVLRIEYNEKLAQWRRNEPPKILFWLWLKWKKARPVWDNSAEPSWYYEY